MCTIQRVQKRTQKCRSGKVAKSPQTIVFQGGEIEAMSIDESRAKRSGATALLG